MDWNTLQVILYLHVLYYMHVHVYYCIAGNFRQEKNSPISPPALIGEILFCVNDYIEDMATITALVKLFHQIFLQYKGS